MATARPLTREQIRQSVSGYDPEVSSESFERMFERDKDELRSMGIPVQTVTNAFDEVLGYRISQDNYRLIDLNLTARELEILSVTQQVWDQAVLGPAARSAVWKIEASNLAASATNSTVSVSESLTGFAQVRAKEAAILPLLKAARERRVVQFLYKPLDKEVEKRVFEPWSVVCRGGRWYTVGFDVVRSERRTFKIARIQGAVSLTAREATQVPQREGLADISFPQQDATIEATISISKSHGASLRKAAASVDQHEEHDVVHVTGSQSDLIEWILMSLPEVRSVEPESLRNEVISTLSNMKVKYRG